MQAHRSPRARQAQRVFGRIGYTRDTVADDSLSRVHALLLQIDDRLLAIDLASTNGTRRQGAPDARILEVAHDDVLELGPSTFVQWSWAS